MEARLGRTADRGPLLLTLGAAGATLLVVLALLGAPAVSTCNNDARGLVTCLRDLIDDRLNGADEAARPAPDEPPAAPVVVDKPTPKVPPAPPMTIAEVAPDWAVREPTPEPDAPPAVVHTAKAEPEPSPASEPAATQAEADPPATRPAPTETIALAEVTEPAPAQPAEAPAPSFVPPPPTSEVEGVPPDLIAAIEPEGAPSPVAEVPAPSFVPPLPVAEVEGVPPDLVASLKPEPAVATTEPTPDFVPPPPTVTLEGPPPDLQAAAIAPAPTPTHPSPAFVLPATPELPTTPPPDLTVAAAEPVAPAPQPPAAAPVTAPPTIDAVEIEGDGSYIAGDGPPGANMRLYVDGVPAGVSPVEGGRWLVEGNNLLTQERQTLQVEALDPATGKQIGEATIVFERPVPEPPAEPVAEAPAKPVVEPPAEAPVAPQAAVEPAEPEVLPPIEPVSPTVESDAVTVLEPADDSVATTLSTSEPPGDAVVHIDTAPKGPALVAQFTLPIPAAAPDVTVLRAHPIGNPDAGRFVSGKAIIRRGDTLWDIAHRYYGHGIHYRTIFRANRSQIARPGKIYPGQVFDLPLVYDD